MKARKECVIDLTPMDMSGCETQDIVLLSGEGSSNNQSVRDSEGYLLMRVKQTRMTQDAYVCV